MVSQAKHNMGDYVLQELAKLFNRVKRPYDVISRYGGEEFVLLLNQIKSEDAIKVSERIRSTIEKHIFSFEGKTIHITVSIGLITLIPSAEHTLEYVVKMADEALYRAKKNGRNCCIASGMMNLVNSASV